MLRANSSDDSEDDSGKNFDILSNRGLILQTSALTFIIIDAAKGFGRKTKMERIVRLYNVQRARFGRDADYAWEKAAYDDR
jgi:hypothetical protein